jgi:hypothetical protein
VKNPMAHKSRIGQSVDLETNIPRSLAATRYEVRHRIPASDRNPHNPWYRIKSAAEKYERAAPESDLTLSIGVST